MSRPKVFAPATLNPLALFLLLLCIASGTDGLIAPDGRGIGLPPIVAMAWNVLLVAGGLTGAAGLLWPDRITGLLIERAAMGPVGVGAYLYAIPLTAKVGIVAGIITAGFGLCAHWRMLQLRRQLRVTP